MTMLRMAPPQPGRTTPPRLRGWDWWLVLPAISLSLLGVALVWSATSGPLLGAGRFAGTYGVRHAMNLALGLGLCWVISRMGHRTIQRATPLLYTASVAGLLLVLSPLGSTVNGAHAWIRLPAGFSIQPAEFAKVAIIVGVALVVSDRAGSGVPDIPTVLRVLAIAGLPMALILLQPDLGTVLVIASVVGGMLVLAGTRLLHLVVIAAAGAAAVGVAFALNVVDQYQLDRLTAFARPEEGALTFGYNTAQARIAIGSGGLWGQGWGHGSQTQGGFVPYDHTDFVFSVVGEELGFVGAAVLLVLLGTVLWRGLIIALRARDAYGRLVAGGVVLWIALQGFENIGMNLGIMPVTGVPLPFVSYGGTSMFAIWIGIGLLLNVHASSRGEE